tara:strand:- start:40 stop:570 length:531 start_codon:yes stop_codon:yes gene_type:complete
LKINKQKNKSGFTLVELIIVIAVLSILSAVAIPAFIGILKKAKVVNAKTNLIYILQECIFVSAADQIADPTFRDLNLGKTINSYGDSYGINFGPHDGFTYNTSISSAMPTRLDSSCMRIAAKSNSTDGLGKTYLFPHFEIYYDNALGKVQKNCVVQAGAYNTGDLCDTSKPYGDQW